MTDWVRGITEAFKVRFCFFGTTRGLWSALPYVYNLGVGECMRPLFCAVAVESGLIVVHVHIKLFLFLVNDFEVLEDPRR